jgi:hypothetical protein
MRLEEFQSLRYRYDKLEPIQIAGIDVYLRVAATL